MVNNDENAEIVSACENLSNFFSLYFDNSNFPIFILVKEL